MSMSMSSNRSRLPALIRLVGTLLLLLAGSAHAADFRVGDGAGCTHSTIQAAINAAHGNPGPDRIHIARNLTWTAQELVIDTAQELDLIGGYDTCATATPNGTTTLDGAGGNARSVLRIIASSGAWIRLRRLVIRGGDIASGGEGGGIFFQGNGRLDLADTTLTQNTAGYGAGLFARGTGIAAEVLFGSNVIVSDNTARYSGGGVYIDQLEFAMREPGSVIMWNTAEGLGGTGGYGGGLMIRSGNLNAYAYLGPGVTSLGTIFANTGVFGGGVAVVSQDTDEVGNAMLLTQMTSAESPMRIRGNTATQAGGGLYTRSWNSATSGLSLGSAWLWNSQINENQAPDGAAIYVAAHDSFLGSPWGSNVDINAYALPDTNACPVGQPCGSISDNRAATFDNQLTNGAIIRVEESGRLVIGSGHAGVGGVLIEGNQGGSLVHAGDESKVNLQNTLIADNTLTGALIDVGSGDDDHLRLRIIDSTLAGNEIGGSHMLAIGERGFQLSRSIFWQPGKPILQCNGCARPFGTFDRIIASERDSLDGGNTPEVLVASPRFVDLANGDYRLRAASPAVDATVPVAGDDRDVLGMPRDQRLPLIVGAARDIGALERQSLMPLLHNGDFDINLNAWEALIPGAISRDGSQNASGGTGSGSMLVSVSNIASPRVTAARQCVHLPFPARYTLNAWGKSHGLFTDQVTLRWELRLNGSEDCTGPVIASGDHDLTSGNAWHRPAQAVTFDVTAEQWTTNTSLGVYAVVTDSVDFPNGGVLGRFDGVTLEIESLDDLIFADGFE